MSVQDNRAIAEIQFADYIYPAFDQVKPFFKEYHLNDLQIFQPARMAFLYPLPKLGLCIFSISNLI